MIKDDVANSAASGTSANERLPSLLVTSVVRSTHQGESHGGVYLVDPTTEVATRVLDWDQGNIEWEGRGGDRGLRGAAFHRGRILLAASDEIFIFDTRFETLDTIRNPYLKLCHEIFVEGDTLYITSTGFDSVLCYDLRQGRFTAGYVVRFGRLSSIGATASRKLEEMAPGRRGLVHPRLHRFDPERSGGPEPLDTTHINSVTVHQGSIFFSGTRLQHLYRIANGTLSPHARIPFGTHNAQPFGDGVIYNNTRLNEIVVQAGAGARRRVFPVTQYDESALRNTHLDRSTARQGFARGLAVWQDRFLFVGSSPATVTVYDLSGSTRAKTITIDMDVRNAVHGLEIWPFDTSASVAAAGLENHHDEAH